MKTAQEKLHIAQAYALANRPTEGGFPFFAECLRQAGVKKNNWSLPSAQSLYLMENDVVVQQGTPLLSGTSNVPPFDQKTLITALRTDRAGKSTFPEFLMAAWIAGVVRYEVDFLQRTVTYYGAREERYEENYLRVEVGEISFE